MKKLMLVVALLLTVAAFAAPGDRTVVVGIDPAGKVQVSTASGETRVLILVGQSVQVGDVVRELPGGRAVADNSGL